MDGGFTGAFQLVGMVAGLVIAFVAMPGAYAMTWPWFSNTVLWQYGAGVQSWAPLIWSCLLFGLIYAAVRAGLFLAIALGGLLLALSVIFRRWKD
ncbi:hypothetical protein [uncultured Roseobacter sp.]|uniref:hypothetical protein n=1 Tax=uncultured Roseobacter sp. TaxID=114847 RepID=UPI002627A2A4|nr:hypothetical protein [uncultured Roseobacter sp.]